MKKRSLQIGITLIINVVFFYLAGTWLYHNINLTLVMHDISHINNLSIAILAVMSIILIIPYAFRMAKLLDNSIGTCFNIIAMGFGFNSLFPFRIGDVVKIYFTKRFYNINITKITYASVIEKLFDIALIAALGSLFALQTIHGNVVINVALVTLVTTLGIYLVQKYRHLILKIKFIPRDLSEHIIDTMDEVLNGKKFNYLIINTLLIWFYTGVMMYIFFSLNLGQGQFHFIDALCIIVIVTFALSVPSTPASIGIYESGIVFYLTTALHIPADQAVAYALIIHLGCMVPQILLSLFILVMGLSKKKPDFEQIAELS